MGTRRGRLAVGLPSGPSRLILFSECTMMIDNPSRRGFLIGSTAALTSAALAPSAFAIAKQPPAIDPKRPAAAAGMLLIGGDLLVSRLGFGAMRITGEGIWGEPRDGKEARAVLRRAVELGTNFIDTADAYGPNVSERLIKDALYPYPKRLVIATKGGIVRPSRQEWVSDGRPEHLREACEASLKRLKLEQIALYQLHSPDPKEPFESSVADPGNLR